MARSAGLLALFGTFAPAALAATTTSVSSIFDIFVIDPTGAIDTPEVQASVISVDPALSQTAYWVTCPMQPGESRDRPLPPPCKYLDGASVTVNPTGMTMRVRRASQIVSVTNALDEATTWETSITVTATATCAIDGSTSASCTGHMTSQSTATTRYARPTDDTNTNTPNPTNTPRTTPSGEASSSSSTWGITSIETISTELSDVTAHSIPVTVTAGLEKLESAATSATVTTSSSTGAAAKATAAGGMGRGRGAMVGVAALAGGVVGLM